MNESALLKLKVVVERAVRPVRASLARKKKMREELLAHVIGVFEDEFPRCGDEQKALLQVEKRFGNSQEISQQLQQSVPKNHRASILDEQLFRQRPGEPFLQMAWRYSVWAFLWQMAILILMELLNGRRLSHPIRLYLQIVITGSISGALFALLVLANAMRQSLFVSGHRSFVRFSVISLITCVISYIPPLVFDAASSPFLIRERSMMLDWDATDFYAFPFATLMLVIILSWITNAFDVRSQSAEEWAKVQID